MVEGRMTGLQYNVKCDGTLQYGGTEVACGMELKTTKESPKAARDFAETKGWKTGIGGHDLCPCCQALQQNCRTTEGGS